MNRSSSVSSVSVVGETPSETDSTCLRMSSVDTRKSLLRCDVTLSKSWHSDNDDDDGCECVCTCCCELDNDDEEEEGKSECMG